MLLLPQFAGAVLCADSEESEQEQTTGGALVTNASFTEYDAVPPRIGTTAQAVARDQDGL